MGNRRPAADPEMPKDLEAEISVLGAMLLDEDAVAVAADALEPKHFFADAHGKIFAAILAIAKRGERPDAVMLMHELRARDELELIGGPERIAMIIERSTTAANLDQHAHIVRATAARREIARLSRGLEQSVKSDAHGDLGVTVERTLDRITVARDGLVNGRAKSEWIEFEKGGERLYNDQCEPLDAIVGKGLLVRRGVNFIVGASGQGKTYLTLQLGKCIITGEQFMGYECQRGNVGMLQLEMPQAGLKERWVPLMQEYTEPVRAMFRFMIMPLHLGPLTELRTQDMIIGWCEARKLTALFIDPFDDAYDELDTLKAQEARQAMKAALRIARKANVALVFLHHVNKLQLDRGTPIRTVVLNTLRGSTRLTNPPDTILGLLEAPGRILLGFGKTRYQMSPPGDQIALKRLPTGYFEMAETADEQLAGTREAIMDFLMRVGGEGATLKEISAAVKLTTRTVERHLRDMRVVARAEGRAGRKRYFAPGCEPDEEPQAQQESVW